MQPTEDELIEQSVATLPVIAKRVFASLVEHTYAHGRTFSQIKAVGYLYSHSPATLSDVADALGVALPTASELIDRLVEEGIVSRDTHPSDRRKVVLALTPRAREVGQQLHAVRRAQIRAAMDLMDPEERPIFAKSLQVLANVLLTDAESLPEASPPWAASHGAAERQQRLKSKR